MKGLPFQVDCPLSHPACPMPAPTDLAMPATPSHAPRISSEPASHMTPY